MHYGLLLLSMCIACVYSSPLSRYEQLDHLSRYNYELQDNLEKVSEMLAHFPKDLSEKDENTSESNSDLIFKALSVELEDIGKQQVDNEEDNLEKLNEMLANFPKDLSEKDENTSESNSDQIFKALSVELEDIGKQQVDNETSFQDDSDEIEVNLINYVRR